MKYMTWMPISVISGRLRPNPTTHMTKVVVSSQARSFRGQAKMTASTTARQITSCRQEAALLTLARVDGV